MNKSTQQITELKEELNNIQMIMSEYSEQMVKNKLSNMNESQKTLVIECFAAAKYKNPKIHRYIENWLMLCLLLNIRSPSAYKYLQASAILPLPHPKTVRSHLASINTACGFDKDFLSLLKKKCDKMTDIAKHGVLLFDSINLRKSIAVNASNLTYHGLEDFGEEGDLPQHKEFADHFHVFMWQSLGSNFYQTIGCFASKGEVKA